MRTAGAPDMAVLFVGVLLARLVRLDEGTEAQDQRRRVVKVILRHQTHISGLQVPFWHSPRKSSKLMSCLGLPDPKDGSFPLKSGLERRSFSEASDVLGSAKRRRRAPLIRHVNRQKVTIRTPPRIHHDADSVQ